MSGGISRPTKTPPLCSNMQSTHPIEKIVVIVDEDEIEPMKGPEKQALSPRQGPSPYDEEVEPPRLRPPVVIDLANDFGNDDCQDFEDWQTGAEMTETSLRSRLQTGRQSEIKSLPIRNVPIAAPLRLLDKFTINNIKVHAKSNLELCGGDFMRVVHVIQDMKTSEVSLRGWIFQRTKLMNGLLEPKLNEVCWILHVDENDTRAPGVQGMQTFPVSKVLRRRRIRMTNRPFPELSWREDPIDALDVITNERVLICRFKYVCYYSDARARERNDWCEKVLQRLRADECDPTCGTPDEELRQSWRGDTIKGGACKTLVPEEVEFLLNERQHRNVGESLKTRKRRRSSLLPYDHAQSQSETRRGSVASLITEDDLAQGPEIAMDDDIQEIDPPSQVYDRLSLQPSPRRAGAPIMRNIDQSPTVQSCPRFLYLKEGSKPEFVHVAKRPKTKMQSRHTSKITFVDLTLDEPTNEGELCSLFDTAAPEHIKRADSQVRSSRYASPEVMEIRAQIDTSCKLGTMRREFQGQITSKYLPNPSNPLKASENSKSVISNLTKASSPFAMAKLPVMKSERQRSPLAANPRPRQTPVSRDESRLASVIGQRYSFGDCFSGAGGTSRGAVDAGLRVEWGFDFNIRACQSYALNYVGAKVYNIDAHRFIGLTDIDHKVDICHLSPPCQYFSDAHTVSGKNDDANIASLFAVHELLNKAKPRVVTLEQTAGLVRRHRVFFNAVVLMFTSRGFSVRWRVLDCANYGLPQHRQRLFMIASCPGEGLPNLPTATHTKDTFAQPGLKPWTFINEIISTIPSNYPDHDIDSAHTMNEMAYDGDSLSNCITTTGGNMIHPSGRRHFTIREFACLQGFPLEQRFISAGVTVGRRQIGNAVPPIVAKVVLEGVKRALMKADGVL